MRRFLTVLLAALALVVATGVSAQALLKVHCGATVGLAAVDPIVHHNDPAAPQHNHQFFANNSWLSKGVAANYSDLSTGTTACRETADTAAYWTPTLINNATGATIPSSNFLAYYRPFQGVPSKVGPGDPYPADTRLVASSYDWTCGQNSAKPNPVQTIPDCTGDTGGPGNTLTAHIDFPSCWDGVLPNHLSTDVGNTSDNAHYAFPIGSGASTACPTGFPHQMTELRESVEFPWTGAATVHLSSDTAPNLNGSSMHGDFWNAWQQAAFASLISQCVNAPTSPTAVCDK